MDQLDSQVLFVKIHGHKTLIDRKASRVVQVEIAHLNLAYDQGMDSDIHVQSIRSSEIQLKDGRCDHFQINSKLNPNARKDVTSLIK
jgi:hypothetical protein